LAELIATKNNGALPEFVTVTRWLALGVDTACDPKLSAAGNTLMLPDSNAPLSGTRMGLLGKSPEIITCPDKVTADESPMY